MDLRANTAVDVLIGPFVDSTDGDTEETGLTLSQADITLSKNGQALAQKNDVTAAAHDANGYYNCELDATDTNTEGNLLLRVHESGSLNVRHEFNVLAEAAWDSLYAAKDAGFMDVNIKAISEDTGSADNLELDYDGTGYAKVNSTIGTCTANTDMVAEAPTAAAVVDEWETQSQADPTGFHVNVLEIGGTAQTANDNGADINTLISRVTAAVALASVCTEGRLAELDAANIPTDAGRLTAARAQVLDDWINAGRLDVLLDAIKVVTDAQTVDGSGLSAMPWNAAWDAEVQSEVNDALVAFFTSSAQLVDDILDETGSVALVGNPTSLRELIYFAVQVARNKMEYIKATDKMKLYEDDNIADKWEQDMLDDATEATRGKGA